MRYDLRVARQETTTANMKRMSKTSQKPMDIVSLLYIEIPAIKPMTANSRGEVLMIYL
jgi:hypothetical protein